jgi:hypothetical protein
MGNDFTSPRVHAVTQRFGHILGHPKRLAVNSADYAHVEQRKGTSLPWNPKLKEIDLAIHADLQIDPGHLHPD